MVSEEYEIKWRETLDRYKDLVVKNQSARAKLINYKPGNIPVPITEDELQSLKAESQAWGEFLELARNPY